MKKEIFISLLVVAMGVMAFMGCEREQIVPNGGQSQQRTEDSLINQQQNTEDSLINQQSDTIITPTDDSSINHPEYSGPVEHWKAVLIDGYYNYIDGTYHHNETYTYAYMDIYPQDSVLYTIDIDTADHYGLFGNKSYSSYSMDGDTITVDYQSDYELAIEQRRWLVVRTNDTTMNWQYLGWEFCKSSQSFMFYLIGSEY